MVATIAQSERDLAKIAFSLRQVIEGVNQRATWTPVLTFATPGDLSVAYTTQVGDYLKIGRLVVVMFEIVTSTFTFTTASGALTVTGLPFIVSNSNQTNSRGTTGWQGITKGTYAQVGPMAIRNTNTLQFQASGSALPISTVTAADTPSAGTVILRGTISYFADL